MRVLYLAREYPPHVYGGAGVHLEYLVREMSRLAEVEVRCFGDQRPDRDNPVVRGYAPHDGDFEGPGFAGCRARGALQALQTSLSLNAPPIDADVVHCHTWYAHLGGVVAKLAYGVPLVVTVHSLEPMRPWKREQLGRGYEISSWIERTALEMADAVIAVSEGDRERVLEHFRVDPQRVHSIPNGVDLEVFRPVDPRPTLDRHGIDPDGAYVLFVGRIARQKGLTHFLRAAAHLPVAIQVVLCAASPDSPEVEAETEREVEALRRQGFRVIWIRRMLEREQTVALYSGATVFCCPSIYEPFGIINLEAMACETPVVATAVGGIREVVLPDITGLLVPFEPVSGTDAEPARPELLARDLSAAMRRLIEDPALGERMGKAGRKRVLQHYGWDRVAARVHAVYRGLTSSRGSGEAAPSVGSVGRDC